MLRHWLSVSCALAACAQSPQKADMPRPGPSSETTAKGPGQPAPEPVALAENAVPSPREDSPAEAEGRRTLSTAFVMIGSGGHLVVELRDGRTIVLRDLVMRARDYCGVPVAGGGRYCGGYAEIAAARAGSGPTPGGPDPATIEPAGVAKGAD